MEKCNFCGGSFKGIITINNNVYTFTPKPYYNDNNRACCSIACCVNATKYDNKYANKIIGFFKNIIKKRNIKAKS